MRAILLNVVDLIVTVCPPDVRVLPADMREGDLLVGRLRDDQVGFDRSVRRRWTNPPTCASPHPFGGSSNDPAGNITRLSAYNAAQAIFFGDSASEPTGC